MTEITPALLAEFKHRVPDGMTIPAGTPTLMTSRTQGTAILLTEGWRYNRQVGHGDSTDVWTREPIRPPLPTGLGAVLRSVTTTWNATIPVLVRADHLSDEDCRWFMATIPGPVDDRWLRDENLATWTVVSEGVEL